MDKLDNLTFVIISLWAAARGVMIYRACARDETSAWRAIIALAVVSLLFHAVKQFIYVLSITVPNGWYESVAHFMALVLAALVVGNSNRRRCAG